MIVMVLAPAIAASSPQSQIPTTLEDFFQPGSQPNGDVVYDSFISSHNCSNCHAVDGTTNLQIYNSWQGSMMAQAARDPLFDFDDDGDVDTRDLGELQIAIGE